MICSNQWNKHIIKCQMLNTDKNLNEKAILDPINTHLDKYIEKT